MSILINNPDLRITDVHIDAERLSVDLIDGRSISVPLAWYPRLFHATAGERKKWRLIGKGQGIHWNAVDEDISVEGLLAGRPSGESQASFAKWLEKRKSRRSARPIRRKTRSARD